jgi:hypothetical protein
MRRNFIAINSKSTGFGPVCTVRNAVAALALAATCGMASAGSVYNEVPDGDLSGDGLNTTDLTFSEGSNEVYGTTGRSPSGVADREYFSFEVPAGFRLASVLLLAETTTGGTGFLGIQSGPQVTLPFTPPDATGLLGWVHYEDVHIGTDILDDIGASAFGATGFVPPLGPGTYSVWLQDTSFGELNFGLDFVLKSVPDQGTGVLGIALGSLAAASMFRRRTSAC